jgi:hypothetical protein
MFHVQVMCVGATILRGQTDARVPLEVLNDVIGPFLSFSTILDSTCKALRMGIATMPPPLQLMQAHMARPSP